ncbi:MAG TPA: urease subunit gamma [Candidatus Limnocylindrales bacterium]|nr:urease subunit gamma [Candidatus Limnocylindrales bacterium]
MLLTPWEEERLLIFGAAELARRHRAAGIPLNAPEAVALVCDAMLEAARAGSSYEEVELAGLAAVSPDEVLPGVRELVPEVRLEVLLDDGTRLVVLLDPLRGQAGAGTGGPAGGEGPGAVRPAADEPRDPTAGLERRTLLVENTSRRAIRVSSHFPFERVNPRLTFERAAATGFRLDLPAGSSERWAPGEKRTVTLVRFRGGT